LVTHAFGTSAPEAGVDDFLAEPEDKMALISREQEGAAGWLR
jgi:high-affinity K+ transport system ATPase subunit B